MAASGIFWSFVLVADSESAVAEADSVARSTAQAHGVEYDGWAFADGEPLKLSVHPSD